ncbi:gmf family protein [Botrytis cinerea]
MSSESRLYTFSTETKAHLRKFRLGTSRASDPQAVILWDKPYHQTATGLRDMERLLIPSYPLDFIDKSNLEIKQDEDGTVYKDLESIGDDLPDHSPRFILLSYPCTLPSGRLSVPYVLIFYLPPTVNAEQRMLYAGAKELMRNTAEVSKVLEIESVEDLEEIPGKLKGDER